MSVLGFLLLVLIAGGCGILGQMLAGFSLGGLLISILVGFAGAWIGWWIATNFELPAIFQVTVDGRTFPVFWAIIGSAILAALVGLLTRPRSYA
jgi:uncharacterized membrane protein YeaQ/YmgE (transglycosylase-associated protein family)